MDVKKKVCKVCLKLHDRVFSHKWGNSNCWRDEHGLLWNGRVCGQCNRVDMRSRVKRHRDKKKNG